MASDNRVAGPTTAATHQHQTSPSPIPADATEGAPQDTPRAFNSASAHSSAVLRARTSTQQSQQQQQQPQPQVQPQGQVQTRRADAGIPIWFDALILGLATLLVGLVIRRFM